MDSTPNRREKNPFSNKNGFLSTESTRRKLGTKSCDKIGGFMRLEICLFLVRFFLHTF